MINPKVVTAVLSVALILSLSSSVVLFRAISSNSDEIRSLQDALIEERQSMVTIGDTIENQTKRVESLLSELRTIEDGQEELISALKTLRNTISTTVEGLGLTSAQVYDSAKQGVVSISVYDDIGRLIGTGSGFIHDDNGHVVTADHVIAGGSAYVLTFLDGTTVSATITGRDSLGDIAVLHAELPSYAEPLPFADSLTLKIGEQAHAMGSPVGLIGSITSGIISQVNRTLTGQFLFYIQTDAPINPGNSGGPLLNNDGEVVGMNTLGVSTADGLGFAIPSSIMQRVVPVLIAGESYRYPLMGVFGTFIDPITARTSNLPESVTSGWLVIDIAEGSGAASSDLRRGDIILTIDGFQVRQQHDVSFLMNQVFSPGDTIKLGILRGSERISVDLVLGSR